MCLDTVSERFTASEDITVYKVVHRFGRGLIRTPYMDAPVMIGEVYESIIRFMHSNRIDVALHSFKFKKDAYKEAHMWWAFDTAIVECIIPKGSSYFEGLFDEKNRFASYASDKLKYVKRIRNIKRKID